jgi:hypothetical protein
MTTRDAGLTQEQVEAAEVHAAGSSHCGEIKSKSAFSRYSTFALKNQKKIVLPFCVCAPRRAALVCGCRGLVGRGSVRRLPPVCWCWRVASVSLTRSLFNINIYIYTKIQYQYSQ